MLAGKYSSLAVKNFGYPNDIFTKESREKLEAELKDLKRQRAASALPRSKKAKLSPEEDERAALLEKALSRNISIDCLVNDNGDSKPAASDDA